MKRRDVLKIASATAGALAVSPFAARAAAVPAGDTRETDVVVVGGGPAGSVAALQAARAGAKTTLIEMGSQLGGLTLQNDVFSAGDAVPCRASLRWLRRVFSRCRNRWLGSTDAAWPTAVGIVLALALSSGGAAESEPQGSEAVPGKVWRYAQRWVARHDTDGDGRLTEAEWRPVDGNLGAADANRDSIVTVDELAQHIAAFGAHRRIRLMPAGAGGVVPLPSFLPPAVSGGTRQPVLPGAVAADLADETELDQDDLGGHETPDHSGHRKYFVPPSRLPPGLPDWFQKADRDGDGQLTFAEYAELGSPSADKEFAKYDRNRDGLITPARCWAAATGCNGRPSPFGLPIRLPSPFLTPFLIRLPIRLPRQRQPPRSVP